MGETIYPEILYFLSGDIGQIENCITCKIFNNNYFYINGEGEYDINLYGKIDPSEASHHSFLSVLIKCDSSPQEKYYFLSFLDDY